MDRDQTYGAQNGKLERHLAHLKILSRLLGHELHAQAGGSINISRDQLQEIQTALDLFIESFHRQGAGRGLALDIQPAAPARVN